MALKGQLDEVLPQLGQLRYLPDRLAQLQAALEQERARADGAETQASGFEQQLASSEADRRDLARALAEVEAELPTAKAALDEERMGRAAVDEELTTVKESLHEAEEKARALEVEKLEALGNLDAVNGQYQEMASTGGPPGCGVRPDGGGGADPHHRARRSVLRAGRAPGRGAGPERGFEAGHRGAGARPFQPRLAAGRAGVEQELAHRGPGAGAVPGGRADRGSPAGTGAGGERRPDGRSLQRGAGRGP